MAAAGLAGPGIIPSWILGWAYWRSVVSLPAIEAEATRTFRGGRFPEPPMLTTVDGVRLLSWPRGIPGGCVLVFAFFALDFFGARCLAESSRWTTLWAITLPTVRFIFAFFILNGKLHLLRRVRPHGRAPRPPSTNLVRRPLPLPWHLGGPEPILRALFMSLAAALVKPGHGRSIKTGAAMEPLSLANPSIPCSPKRSTP